MKIFKTSIFVFLIIVLPITSRAESDFFLSASLEYKNVKVERVINADTIVLENGKKIRLIGLKALEAPKRYNLPRDEYGFIIEDTSDPTTSLEETAYDFALELMSHKKVRVEFDTQSVDESGHMYGYVFLSDGTMANAEILRQGYAGLQIRPPNLKYADQLREAYREARAEKRGIHLSQ